MAKKTEENKIKIGAKKLTEKEVKNILPTYDKLINQLEEFREYAKSLENDKSNKKIDSIFSSSQVMNNIAIIGERGSGKTSIMKTIYNDLEELNKQDESKSKYLILPSIVPENMVDTMTVVACFLGLLKDCVDNIREKREKEEEKNFCYFKNTEIEKDFNKLIKNFGYLQKRYQEIAVNTYTTESNYVEETKKMFSANNKFILEFNDFIDKLLKEAGKDILVIFIDDIDLSVNKSLDIIKTLLIYLSNPKIATIISCDLNTFQEAITLEFTKQDNLQDSEFLKFDYVNGNNSSEEYNLLRRKFELTYEYLKKILPPAYRHNVNKWGLEIRHKYFYDINIDDNKNNKKELLGLLNEVSSKKELLKLLDELSSKNELLEKYFCVGEQPIIQIFNIFDSTSRGLNNVYCNIYELIHNEAPIEFQQYKLLLENIVYSNPTLNNNRELIFGSLLKFGIDVDTTTVNFEILNEKYNDMLGKGNKDKSTEYFIIFTFLDFSCKLLGMDPLRYNKYNGSKENALKCLFYYSQLSGRNIKYTYPENIKDFKLEYSNKDNIKQLILDLYLNLEFEKAIVFFNEINFEKLLSENFDKENKDVLRTRYFLKIYSILKMTEKSFEKSELNKYIGTILEEDKENKEDKDYNCINLTKYMDNSSIKKLFNTIENELFADKSLYLKLLLTENVFTNDLKEKLESKYKELYKHLSNNKFSKENVNTEFNLLTKGCLNGLELHGQYKEYLIKSLYEISDDINTANKDYEKLVYNYIDEEYTKEFINENTFLKDFEDFKNTGILEKNKGIVDYIKKITAYNLWNYDLTENVKEKIDLKISKFEEKHFIENENELKSEVTSGIELKIDDEIGKAIRKMEDVVGISKQAMARSNARKCKVIFEELNKVEADSVYKYFIFDACLKYLLYRSTSNYGKKEADESLKELDKLGLNCNFSDEDKQEYKFLLYCYLYKNKCINPEIKDIDSKLCGEFLDSIKYSRAYLNDYKLKNILENVDKEGKLFIEEIRNDLNIFEDEDENKE